MAATDVNKCFDMILIQWDSFFRLQRQSIHQQNGILRGTYYIIYSDAYRQAASSH